MASPRARITTTRNRLRKKLDDAKQSLADQFEFKIFVAFVFKDKVRPGLWVVSCGICFVKLWQCPILTC